MDLLEFWAFEHHPITKLNRTSRVTSFLDISTIVVPHSSVDDELKKFLQFLLTNDKFKPPNHKKLLCFTLVCLWNVQIQILNQPKRPS